MLDLTAAFDTVDHDLLLICLERQYGLRGVVLRWFQPYLSGRSYQVIYVNRTSSIVYIVCSVPQGSVLGSRLFILYKADLAHVVQQYHVNFHAYADDNDDIFTVVRTICCGTTRMLSDSYQPLDGRKPSQAERREDGTALGQLGDIPQLS